METMTHQEKRKYAHLTISELLEVVEKKKARFVREAIRESSFAEEHLGKENGRSKTRRPIVVLNDPQYSKRWQDRIAKLGHVMDLLHEKDPERYPENCYLLRTRPIIIKQATKCTVHQKAGVDSKLIQAKSIAARLRVARRKIVDANDLVIDKNLQLKIIDDAIALIESRVDEKIRVRVKGYADIIAHVSYLDKEHGIELRKRARVTEMGLFIIPAAKARKSFKSKEQILTEKPNLAWSIYSKVKEIPIPLPMSGKMYWENDVLKVRGKLDGSKIAENLPIMNPPAI